MTRLILTATVLMPLFLFAAGEKKSEANVNASTAPTIAASPNPVPGGTGTGTTTITWNTGDGTMGHVYVSQDGKEESLFASSAQDSKVAAWIQTGSTYRFRLYNGTGREKLLAEISVSRQKETGPAR